MCSLLICTILNPPSFNEWQAMNSITDIMVVAAGFIIREVSLISLTVAVFSLRSPAKSYTKFWQLAAYNSLAVIFVPLPPQIPESEGFHSTPLWNYSSHSNPGWRPI
ncbi:hypothetical protein [Salmonella enterica]|uniref:hypothetical protein n=1 Tax=Salmonella enterica TaxID=28901 RepID=UPI0011162296|nr:hypothetical protein [Salmonella enterica]